MTSSPSRNDSGQAHEPHMWVLWSQLHSARSAAFLRRRVSSGSLARAAPGVHLPPLPRKLPRSSVIYECPAVRDALPRATAMWRLRSLLSACGSRRTMSTLRRAGGFG